MAEFSLSAKEDVYITALLVAHEGDAATTDIKNLILELKDNQISYYTLATTTYNPILPITINNPPWDIPKNTPLKLLIKATVNPNAVTGNKFELGLKGGLVRKKSDDSMVTDIQTWPIFGNEFTIAALHHQQ